MFKFPLTMICIGVVSGILLAYNWSICLQTVWTGGFLTFILLLYFSWIASRSKVFNSIFVFFSFIAAIFIGILTWELHKDTLSPKHYIYQNTASEQDLLLTIDTKLKPSVRYHKYYAQINRIGKTPASGKVLLNLEKRSFHTTPDIGAVLYVQSDIKSYQSGQNPGQFDYGAYLRKQQIYGQIFTDSTHCKQVGLDKNIYYFTHKIREQIISNLKKSGFREKELSVFQALILGQRQDMSPEIIQAYQYAGAIHILSVSGLHVAYIYLFINFLLYFIPNHKTGKLLRLILLLLLLWGFAFLAGLAPAIVRAVVMFSFVSIGNYLNRNTNIFYTLIVSILLILLINPSFLFDVGFQLSYLALFFIVWAKPILDSLYRPSHKITQYIWDIATVSLAAQIGVLPLSLYYFHQFPTLFIITNLLILLPLSGLMIYGLGLSILAFLGLTHPWLSYLMELGIAYINQVSFEVSRYESFVFKDIPFDFILFICWYGLIFLLFLWLKKPLVYRALLLSLSVISLQLVYLYNDIKAKKSEEFIVFNKPRSTLITHNKNGKITVFSNALPQTNQYLLKGYRATTFGEFSKQDSLKNFYYTSNKKIMLIDGSSVYDSELLPDILILSESPKINLERIFRTHKPYVVVADASNYISYVQKWQTTCLQYGVLFHSTYNRGAFVLTH